MKWKAIGMLTVSFITSFPMSYLMNTSIWDREWWAAPVSYSLFTVMATSLFCGLACLFSNEPRSRKWER